MDQTEIMVAKTPADYAEGRALIEEYAAALGVDLCFQNFSEEIADLEKIYGPSRGCLLLARNNGKLVGCVAFRSKEETVCEMKRLYINPSCRGSGLGRRLTETAIRHARQFGYSQMVLDTLPSMAEAQALYESLGFREIESYYQNPLSGVRYLALDIATR